MSCITTFDKSKNTSSLQTKWLRCSVHYSSASSWESGVETPWNSSIPHKLRTVTPVTLVKPIRESDLRSCYLTSTLIRIKAASDMAILKCKWDSCGWRMFTSPNKLPWMSSACRAGVVVKIWKNCEAYQKEGQMGMLEELYNKGSFMNIVPSSTFIMECTSTM